MCGNARVGEAVTMTVVGLATYAVVVLPGTAAELLLALAGLFTALATVLGAPPRE